MRSILIVCNDALGSKMAGPSIRCVEMAKVLSSQFLVAVTATKINDFATPDFITYEHSSPRFLNDVRSADVIIIQGDALKAHPFLKKSPGVLIADLYCPVPLEYHQTSVNIDIAQRGRTSGFLSRMLLEQLVYADHFLCASRKQEDFWLGALMLAGRVNPYRWPHASQADVSDLISQLPFGLPRERPAMQRHAIRAQFGIAAEDFVMVWGGGIYQWFDPLTIIRAVHRLTHEGIRLHLVFIGVKHPSSDVEQQGMSAQAVVLATELNLIGNFVHFNFGWVDYTDRHNFLMDADVGVSAHFDNPETRFSFRTRMLDYLWCGLPIIATRGDVFADSLAVEKFGLAVDFEDVEGWSNALRTVIADRALLAKFRIGAVAYAKRFYWNEVVEPLAVLCQTIVVSPDRDYIRNRNSIISRIKSEITRSLFILKKSGLRNLVSATIRRLRRALR